MAGSVGSWVGAGGLRAAAWVAVVAMCAAFDPYPPIVDLLPPSASHRGERIVRDHPMTFAVYDGGVDLTTAWVAEQIRPLSDRIPDRILEQEPGLMPCRFETLLEVCSVPYEVLNDRRRFNQCSFPGTILAPFDVRQEDWRVSAIVLTPHHDRLQQILTHELAHDWHHRSCLERRDSFPETETFAVAREGL